MYGPERGRLSELSLCGICGNEKSMLGFISILGTPPVASATLPILSMLLLGRWWPATATPAMVTNVAVSA